MNNFRKIRWLMILPTTTLVFLAILILARPALAHPGNTDTYGCHTCRTNCTSWGLSYGEYHCHNPKPYLPSIPTTPTCPSMSYYDSLSESCKCMSGYVVGTDYSGNQTCVSGDSECRDRYGYGARYDSLSNKCECGYGYIMYGSKCVDEDTYCTDTVGYHSRYNSLYDKCECDYGYVYSNNRCVDEDAYCENILGNNSSYNSLFKKCECDYGYEFDGSDCVEEEQTYYAPPPANISCPANSLKIGDSCYCKAGYQVGADKLGCVEIPKSIEPAKPILPTASEKTPEQIQDTQSKKEPAPDLNKKPIECGEGYVLLLNKKYCVKIPLNAHATNSATDVWLCNDGYKEMGDICLPFETHTQIINQNINATSSATSTPSINGDQEKLNLFGNLKLKFGRFFNSLFHLFAR